MHLEVRCQRHFPGPSRTGSVLSIAASPSFYHIPRFRSIRRHRQASIGGTLLKNNRPSSSETCPPHQQSPHHCGDSRRPNHQCLRNYPIVSFGVPCGSARLLARFHSPRTSSRRSQNGIAPKRDRPTARLNPGGFAVNHGFGRLEQSFPRVPNTTPLARLRKRSRGAKAACVLSGILAKPTSAHHCILATATRDSANVWMGGRVV